MDVVERAKLDAKYVMGGLSGTSLEDALISLESNVLGQKLRKIPNLIEEHWKSIKKSPRKYLDKYLIASDITLSNSGLDSNCYDPTVFSELSLGEGMYNFCLLYNLSETGFPENFSQLAGLSFMPRDDYIEVVQIQGMNSKKNNLKESLDALSRVNWNSLLLQYFVDWSIFYDVPMVKVLGVRNNSWALQTKDSLETWLRRNFDLEELIYMSRQEFLYYVDCAKREGMDESSIHLWPNRGYEIYDTTALDLGFSPDGWGNYELYLGNLKFI